MNSESDSHTILFINVCVDLPIIQRTRENVVGADLNDV